MIKIECQCPYCKNRDIVKSTQPTIYDEEAILTACSLCGKIFEVIIKVVNKRSA